MFDSRVVDGDNCKNLIISGELTLSNAELFKTALIDLTKSTNNIILTLNDISDIDLSCLQVIYSAHKTAVNLDKSIEIAGNPSTVLKNALKRSGFSGHKGCLSNMPGWSLLTGENIE